MRHDDIRSQSPCVADVAASTAPVAKEEKTLATNVAVRFSMRTRDT